MTVQESVSAAIETALVERLAQRGLVPALTPGVDVEDAGSHRVRLAGGGHVVDVPAALLTVLEEPRELASHPFTDWPELLRELWTLGIVFLRDEDSSIDPLTAFHGSFRVVIERSMIGPFSILRHGPILLRDASLEGHAALAGPIALDASGLGHHTYAGTFARIRRSFLGPFTKAQIAIDIEGALIASHCAIDGGRHFDFMPFAPADAAAEGVRIGAQSWVGQQVSLTAGARLGRGVVVATGTALSRAVPDHRFVAGTPARDFPIDWHVRDLDADAARAAGCAQGATAAMLPLFGAPRVQWRSASSLELEYAYDANGPIGDFHCGALEALFSRLVPAAGVSVTRDGSRFRVAFDRAIEPHVAFDADVVVELRSATLDGELQQRIASALPETIGRLAERAVQERWLGSAIAGTADAIARELRAMADSGALNVRFSLPVAQAWCRENIAPIERALASATRGGDDSATTEIVAFLHARGHADVQAETPLLSSGRIDSFALAALLTELEQRFGIVIDVDELTPADFDRPCDIAELIARRRSG